ncbi:MAG: hypothetical protein EXS05_19770 [Planctomycetaceae bacterium]|nr:hypothetical protein [Planctomycetaceae bacterium]
MDRLRTLTKRITLLAGLWLLAGSSSGCLLFEAGYLHTSILFSKFFVTTPLIPISPYWSQEIEDTYWEEERYSKVPVLDPVEGENAPLFCMDSPSPDEVMRALPDDTKGGLPFFAETVRNNVRIVTEPIVDSIGECRFYPMVGPAKHHKCHYKCTVYYEKVIHSDWPIPYSHTDQVEDVVYVDHDHLIRCAGPESGGY